MPGEQPNVPFRVRLPDTATVAVLVSELLSVDGPYSDYADHWVRVGGIQVVGPMSGWARAIVERRT